jgi:intracellular septation protein
LYANDEEIVWFKLNIAWLLYFMILGILNLIVAYNFSEDTWANFKLSTIGLLFIFVILQGVWLSKYIDQDNSKSQEKSE